MWSGLEETVAKFAQHPVESCDVACRSEDVVVGADNGGAATMPVEPPGHHPVEFNGASAADRFRSGILTRTDNQHTPIRKGSEGTQQQ